MSFAVYTSSQPHFGYENQKLFTTSEEAVSYAEKHTGSFASVFYLIENISTVNDKHFSPENEEIVIEYPDFLRGSTLNVFVALYHSGQELVPLPVFEESMAETLEDALIDQSKVLIDYMNNAFQEIYGEQENKLQVSEIMTRIIQDIKGYHQSISAAFEMATELYSTFILVNQFNGLDKIKDPDYFVSFESSVKNFFNTIMSEEGTSAMMNTILASVYAKNNLPLRLPVSVLQVNSEGVLLVVKANQLDGKSHFVGAKEIGKKVMMYINERNRNSNITAMVSFKEEDGQYQINKIYEIQIED